MDARRKALREIKCRRFSLVAERRVSVRSLAQGGGEIRMSLVEFDIFMAGFGLGYVGGVLVRLKLKGKSK